VKEMRQVLASCSGLCTTDRHFLQECKDPHLRLSQQSKRRGIHDPAMLADNRNPLKVGRSEQSRWRPGISDKLGVVVGDDGC